MVFWRLSKKEKVSKDGRGRAKAGCLRLIFTGRERSGGIRGTGREIPPTFMDQSQRAKDQWPACQHTPWFDGEGVHRKVRGGKTKSKSAAAFGKSFALRICQKHLDPPMARRSGSAIKQMKRCPGPVTACSLFGLRKTRHWKTKAGRFIRLDFLRVK